MGAILKTFESHPCPGAAWAKAAAAADAKAAAAGPACKCKGGWPCVKPDGECSGTGSAATSTQSFCYSVRSYFEYCKDGRIVPKNAAGKKALVAKLPTKKQAKKAVKKAAPKVKKALK